MAVGPRRSAAVLEALAERVRPVALAREQALPVVPALAPLLPDGLRRGSTVAVGGPAGATSLALALCAGPSAAGSWGAVVGMPSLGLAAAADAGVALERLLVVDPPPAGSWATVVAALADAVDVVLAAPTSVRQGDARRLAARLRERGSVLVLTGSSHAWPIAADIRLAVVTTNWEGLGDGHGRLAARRAEVAASGRGAASRERRASLWLPGPDGRPALVEVDEHVPAPAHAPAPAVRTA